MKKVTLIATSVIAFTSFATAGGDISMPTEPQVTVPMTSATEEESSAFGSMFSEGSFYVGIGGAYSMIYGKDTKENNSDNAVSFTGKIGYDFSQYVGIEGRATVEVAKENILENLSSFGIFVKPQYPATEELNIYGLVGFGQTSIDVIANTAVNAAGTKLNAGDAFYDNSGVQFGAGVSYMVMDGFSVFVDYTQLVLADETEKKTNWKELKNEADSSTDLNVGNITLGVNYAF